MAPGNDNTLPNACVAIQELTQIIEKSTASTLMGLEKELAEAAQAIRASNPTSISLAAGCELFVRYVTRTQALEFADLHTVKQWLIQRGRQFGETSLKARAKVAEMGEFFVKNGSVVLTHGVSRVVTALLIRAAVEGKKHFSVVVTEGRPDGTGVHTAKVLAEVGIPCTLVLDSAVAYMMDRVDMVLVGAEAVVENGGIINKLGTFQIATVAKAFDKPFYVAAESYKFARLFPLKQRDIPFEAKGVELGAQLPSLATVENPSRDFTPPSLITLLFTDLGALTPSAISDELIQLYL